jgi:uncharacterized protein (DUF697 family)
MDKSWKLAAGTPGAMSCLHEFLSAAARSSSIQETAMHNIDRTLSEFEPQYEALQADEFEFESDEYEDSESGVFSEADEMDLASELLTVSDEAELDQFLGKLLKKAAGAVRKVIKTPLGKQVGGLIKGAVKNVLPMATGALGTFVGGPVGTALGSKLGSMASNALGLEMEGMSAEDQEFEIARRLVRLGGEAVKKAVNAPQNFDVAHIARKAVIEAARKHAPGLVRAQLQSQAHHDGEQESEYDEVSSGQGGHGGRWVRRGRKIILMGV